MSTWVLVQIIFNISMALGFFVMWSKLRRPPKDDPRLSRGLQLLQSKITVLEDLSDRTEVQVHQLTALLDKKTVMLQDRIEEADVQTQKVEESMNKSLEVAEIFEDRIPHEDVIKRKEEIKYVSAAQMAHSGVSLEEIMERTGLPKAQVEFIAKVNKDQLMFDDTQLPDWTKENVSFNKDVELTEVLAQNTPDIDYENLDRLGMSFKEACLQFEEEQKQIDHDIENSIPNKVIGAAGDIAHQVGDKVNQTLSASKDVISEQSHKITEKIKDGGEQISTKIKESSEKLNAASEQLLEKTTARFEKNIEDKSTIENIEIIESNDKAVEAAKVQKVQFPKV